MRKIHILVLHGPNLNLLGEREPEIYGTLTLTEINKRIQNFAQNEGLQVRIRQSNSEGTLIDWLHKMRHWADGVVINPAAYTHSSYALRDAIASIALPTIEVHLSNLEKRAQSDPQESFRKISVIQPACIGQISGLGWESYIEGIRSLRQKIAFS